MTKPLTAEDAHRMMMDLMVHGMTITKGGERVDPREFYAEAEDGAR